MLVLEGRAFIEGRIKDCAIGIEDGKIVAIKKVLRGDPHKDYGEFLILPGGIDIHVHFRDPGMTHKEDFRSGSTSAAMGGITTVFDMPNTMPPTVTLSDYLAKAKTAREKSVVDFVLYAALLRPRETQRLAGVRAPFKLYLAETTGGLNTSIEDVPKLLADVPEEYLPIVTHAEDPAKFGKAKAGNLVQHNASRPVEAEVSSISVLRQMTRKFHITHITSEGGLKLAASSHFTADVTPHHLLLDCTKSFGPRGKVNPPLREPAVRAALWKAFVDGRVEILASDHAPHAEDEKSVNFADAPSGIPGVETMLPLMLRRVKGGDVTLERLVNAVSEQPARLMGLSKGSIEIGRDADLIVVDSHQVTKIRGKKLHSKCGWTPFENLEAIFPTAVYLRGNLIVEKGDIAEDRSGEMVRPEVIAGRSERSEDVGRSRSGNVAD